MHPSVVRRIAFEEQARARSFVAGLGPCPIVISRATTMLGSYSVDQRSGRNEIRVSRHLVDEDQVRDTVRHELAHQAAFELHGHLGHGAFWQTWARYLGCEPVACGGGIDPEAERKRQRYVVTCRECGWTITRQRRSPIVVRPWRYACGRCRGSLYAKRIEVPA